MPSLPSKNVQLLKRRKSDHTYAGGSGESWLQNKWRPMMAWIYMITCITDFIIFPILWSTAQTYLGLDPTPWQPLTLQGAGLYHLAMGGVIGISAWTRGKEKEANIFNGMVANPITAQQISYQTSYSGPTDISHPLRLPNDYENSGDDITINIDRKTKEERIHQARNRRKQGAEIYQDLTLMPQID